MKEKGEIGEAVQWGLPSSPQLGVVGLSQLSRADIASPSGGVAGGTTACGGDHSLKGVVTVEASKQQGQEVIVWWECWGKDGQTLD